MHLSSTAYPYERSRYEVLEPKRSAGVAHRDGHPLGTNRHFTYERSKGCPRSWRVHPSPCLLAPRRPKIADPPLHVGLGVAFEVSIIAWVLTSCAIDLMCFIKQRERRQSFRSSLATSRPCSRGIKSREGGFWRTFGILMDPCTHRSARPRNEMTGRACLRRARLNPSPVDSRQPAGC